MKQPVSSDHTAPLLDPVVGSSSSSLGAATTTTTTTAAPTSLAAAAAADGGGGATGTGSCKGGVSGGALSSRCVACGALGVTTMLLLFPLWLNTTMGTQINNPDPLIKGISASGITTALLGVMAWVVGTLKNSAAWMGNGLCICTVLSYLTHFTLTLVRFHSFTDPDDTQGQAFVYGSCVVFVTLFLGTVALLLSTLFRGESKLQETVRTARH